MTRAFDFSQAGNKGITVLPDETTLPNPSDLVVVKTITSGVVGLGYTPATMSSGAAVAVSDVAPAAAPPGSLWFDSVNPGLYLRFNDGTSTQWVSTGNEAAIGTVMIADNPPTAADSSLWWDSSGTGLYVRYNDGNSTQWVATQNPYTLTDAPNNGTLYGRMNGAWAPFSNRTAVNVIDHGAKGDGVTDDTAAIQAVLDANNSKATVFIPWTGNHYRTKGLTLPSGTDLLLYGTLRALPGLTGAYISIENVVNVAIRGVGVIDASGSLQTAVGGMAGLAISLATHVRISGITIQNAFHWNINFTQCDDVVIDGCTITGGGAANEFAAQATDCWMTNCLIDGTNNGDYGFCFYGGVTNSGAIGNVVRNAGAGTPDGPPGIGVMSDVAQQNPCRDIVIANNIIHGCAAGGITVLGNPASSGVVQAIQSGIVVSGNRCYNNGRNATVAGQIADCFIEYVNGVTISDNQFSGFGGSSGSSNGIYLGPSASYVGVIGNQVFNVGQGGSGNSAGLWINSAQHVLVSNNWFYDNQATHTMAWAVIGTAGPACSFTGNFFDVPVSFTQQSDTVMINYSQGGLAVTGGRLSVGYPPVAYTSATNIPRWFVGNAGNTEGTPGSNIGSDFAVTSVRDDGSALIETMLTIKRSTGVVSLSHPITFSGPFINAANDAGAASGGVPVGGMYRNGSALMVRVV